MDGKITQENKMGTMDVKKLLFTMSVPMIISMLVQALYNIVDSIFVASFDNVAGTAALTVAFPMQNLMIAVAVGLAVGMNALLSRALGQKNFDKANKIAGQGIFLTICGYILFLALGVFAVKPYVLSQAAGNELIAEYGIEYLSIICIGSVGAFIQIVCERLLQATGKTLYSMVTQGAGALINIILDPIMIFGLLGCPAMGVTGAALATIIGQISAAVLGIFLNLKFNPEIQLKLKNMIPDSGIVWEILVIGIPSVLMQAIGSLMTFCMNKILMGFENCGVDAMNVFGVYFKLQSFIFMPVFGLNNGMIPIIAYNYGAKKRGRVLETFKLSAVSATVYMLLGLMVFQIMPGTLLGFFDATPGMLEIGKTAFRIISLSFMFAGAAIVASSVCQALGMSIYSLFTSMGRQLVVLIPASFLLAFTGKVAAVWWAFPISEFVGVILAILFVIKVIKHTIGLKENEQL